MLFCLVSKDRAVWSHAFDLLCAEMRLAKYSIQPENLDSHALERVVTAHYRFRVYAKNFSTPRRDKPLFYSTAWSVRCLSEEIQGPVTSLRLLPGGRFLLLIVSPNVQLWDLGFSPRQTRCLASDRLIIPREDTDSDTVVHHIRLRDGKFLFNVLHQSQEMRSVSFHSLS